MPLGFSIGKVFTDFYNLFGADTEKCKFVFVLHMCGVCMCKHVLLQMCVQLHESSTRTEARGGNQVSCSISPYPIYEYLEYNLFQVSQLSSPNSNLPCHGLGHSLETALTKSRCFLSFLTV